uniref:Uncharacterized protein n=1 Tax=Anguilla anguilla TaxID=7936 RepID=A0A0E9QAK8_ANGAN
MIIITVVQAFRSKPTHFII